jgi:hypothetical protein
MSEAIMIANAVSAIISVAMELAHSAKLEKSEIDELYEESYNNMYGKDPASHPHPDFDASIEASEGDES